MSEIEGERRLPLSDRRHRVRMIALVAGPVIAGSLVAFGDLEPGRPAVTRAAAVALLMAVWWVTEAVPLAVTALLPVVLFPLLGVMDGKEVSPLYFNHVIFLFLGGFMVALAMQRWGLHRRIALRILLASGTNPRGILLAFMAATAFLSMWISNSATTMMMVPIALAITSQLERSLPESMGRRYTVGVLLGVAYGASIGGIATLVGTPPNLSFTRIFSITFPDAPEVSFTSWFLFALPVSAVFLGLAWVYLSFVFCPRRTSVRIDADTFRHQYRELGPITYPERCVFAVFVALVVLWLFRADLEAGLFTIPGWSRLFSSPEFLNDGTVAVAMAVVLFLLPSRQAKGDRVLDWATAKRLPWGLVLLFGGGFALASGFKESGLSLWIGSQLAGCESLDPLLLVLIVCAVLTFLTELTSNTATAEMLLPVLAAMAVTLKIHPLLLMVPATMACSCAFMLPVATPPNAITFGSERITIAEMARAGFVLNLVGIILITVATALLGEATLGISFDHFPEWATIK